jgi:uncharacterized protein
VKKQKKQKLTAKHRGPVDQVRSARPLERRAVPVAARMPAQSERPRPAPLASTSAYSHDDRSALLLLMMPFLIVAIAIGGGQALRWKPSAPDRSAIKNIQISAPLTERQAQAATPVGSAAPVVVAVAPPVIGPSTLTPSVVDQGAVAPSAAERIAGQPIVIADNTGATTAATVLESNSANTVVASPGVTLEASKSPTDDVVAAPVGSVIAPVAAAPILAPTEAPPQTPAVTAPSAPVVVAMLVPEPALAPPTGLVTPPAKTDPIPDNSCVRETPIKRTPAFFLGEQAASATIDPGTFGRALAASAREQLDGFTVYTDKYQTLAYPMGDLPAFYGVCTDVIVRAYRELGVDLQQLVHQSKLGSGDTNIDHRRVTTLQRFFAKFGDDLPITEFGEDYSPGDVVSYYRPQNAHSRTHIAIVSDVVGPSGQLMIIHNRGWGPQIEDGLFVDQITGHYRYSGSKGPTAAPAAIASTGKPTAPRAASGPSTVKKVKRAVVGARAALAPLKAAPIQR